MFTKKFTLIETLCALTSTGIVVLSFGAPLFSNSNPVILLIFSTMAFTLAIVGSLLINLSDPSELCSKKPQSILYLILVILTTGVLVSRYIKLS